MVVTIPLSGVFNNSFSLKLISFAGVSGSLPNNALASPEGEFSILKASGIISSNSIGSFGSIETSNHIFKFGGISGTQIVLNPSITSISGQAHFQSYAPDFSRSVFLQAVVGTSGTVEKFFDRSSFYFDPHETDPNTLRDLSEAQQYLIFSSTTVFSYDYFSTTVGGTFVISSKGDELSSDSLVGTDLIRNGSFERNFVSWSGSAGSSDTIELRTSQPLGEGFNDSSPLTVPDGLQMAHLKKAVVGPAIWLRNTSNVVELESSVLRNISFQLAKDVVSPTSSVHVEFFLNDTKNYEVQYLFSGTSAPSPLPTGLLPLTVVTLGALTTNAFTTYTSNILRDMSFASFKFNRIRIWFLLNQTNANLLIDDLKLTADIPDFALETTRAAAHINNFFPSSSGLPFVVSGSAGVLVLDQTPPFFAETVPVSGTSFNLPTSSVSFHVKDLSSSIDQSNTDVWIDNVQVVSGGATVTGSTWPSASKVILALNDIQYTFNRATEFSSTAEVTVSGELTDLASPSNFGIKLYSFVVMGQDNLLATISGSPDSTAPVLTPLNPTDTATNISPNTDIIWSAFDSETGIDTDTVQLFLNGVKVVDGDTNVTGGTLQRVGNQLSGFTYTYNPTSTFIFGETVTGTLTSYDLHSSPNLASVVYSFTITSSDTLEITNFFLPIDSSVVLVDETILTVDVIDAIYGVNVTNTILTINGEDPGFTKIITSSGLTFSGSLNGLVDFTEDLNVLVHAENNFPGSFPVIKEELFILSPGYKVQWFNNFEAQPEIVFPYLTRIEVLADVFNFQKKSNIGSLFYNFLTENATSTDLGAVIISNINTADLPSAIVGDSPYFEYGKLMVLDFEVSDLAGNTLSFSHSFRIQERPV